MLNNKYIKIIKNNNIMAVGKRSVFKQGPGWSEAGYGVGVGGGGIGVGVGGGGSGLDDDKKWWETGMGQIGIAAGVGAVGIGLGSAYGGGGGRRREQQAAQAQLDRRLTQFEGLDTRNIYAGYRNPFSENVYEDLTVNQQQAQFEAQQGQQQRANIMQTLAPAAGGSGIASLAQAMANQGRIQTQATSATIGLQEAANQRLLAQGAQQVQAGAGEAQKLRMYGASMARGLQYEKTQGLIAAATGRKEAADAAIEAAKERQAKLWSDLISLGGTAIKASAGIPPVTGIG